jgi:two-component sensor histidine kinase
LPSSQVWNTYQDKFGYLWIATNDGISRFDGYQFHNYFNNDKTNTHLNGASYFFEDSEGVLWVLNGAGFLNKFDRNADKFIHKKTPLENGWSEQSTHKIVEDSLQNLWFGAYGGMQYYDREKDTVLVYPIQRIRDSTWLHEEKLRFGAFHADKNGKFWLGTRKFGLVKFDSKTKNFDLFRFDKRFNQTCFVDWITDVEPLNERTILISEMGVGLIFFDIIEEKIEKIVKFEELFKLDFQVDIRDIFVENEQIVWLATDNYGIVSYDLKANKVIGNYQKNLSQPLSLASNRVKHINKDKDGNFWIASNTLEIGNPNFYQFKEWKNEAANPNSLLENSIYALATTPDQKVLVSTKAGLSVLNTETNTIDNSYPFNKDKSRAFGNICSENGTYWTGHYDKIRNFDPKTKRIIQEYGSDLELDSIKNCLKISLKTMQDSRGFVWTINQWGRLNYINPTTRKAGTIFDLAQDKQTQKFISAKCFIDDPSHQRIIVGTDFGLFTVNYLDFKIDNKLLITNDLNLKNAIVSYLYFDKSGNLWGIIDGKLYQIDKEYFRLNRFVLDTKYKVENFKWIVEEPRGYYWLSCYKGIIQYEAKTQKTKIFFSQNIGDNTQDSPSPVVQLADKILFGAFEGLTMIEPSKIKKTTTIPTINIESVRFNSSKNIQKDTILQLYDVPEIDLEYFQDRLSIKFVGLNFENPTEQNYEFMLEGYDKDWIQTDGLREAIYTNLANQTYIFKVRTQGFENTKSLKIRIHPPFWQTWWAVIFYLILISGLIYTFIRFRVNSKLQKIQELEAIRIRISSNLHDDVGTILSGLAMQSEMLALTTNKDQKEPLLEIRDMSHDAMERMRDTVWAIDSRKDKYENLIDRMRAFTEKNLNLKNIKHNFNIEVEDTKAFISPEVRQNLYLILKEAITNICKHSDATQVTIIFRNQKSHLYLAIYDNGITKQTENSDGLGLNNMQMRAKKIGAKLRIDKTDGFKVIVEM